MSTPAARWRQPAAARRLTGTFHVDPLGDGTFGPFAIVRDDGSSLAGSYFLNRRASQSGFWLSADDFTFADLPDAPHLPALALAPPAFGGRLDGDVAGVGPPSRFRRRRTGSRAWSSSSGPCGSTTSRAMWRERSRTFGSAAIRARGPWGTYAGDGAYADGRLALDGRYDGSFAAARGP